MGIRVSFWMGAEDGIGSHFLSAPLDQFEDWASETEAEFPNAFGTVVLDLIRDVRSRGAMALQTTHSVRAAAIDNMMGIYYGHFCDSGPGRDLLVEASASIVSVGKYYAAIDLLNRADASSGTLRLWTFLLEGRPAFRDPDALPFISDDGVFRLSYWTFEECSHLLPDLARAARCDTSNRGTLYSSVQRISDRGMLLRPLEIALRGPEDYARDALDIALGACARAIGERVGLIITGN